MLDKKIFPPDLNLLVSPVVDTPSIFIFLRQRTKFLRNLSLESSTVFGGNSDFSLIFLDYFPPGLFNCL